MDKVDRLCWIKPHTFDYNWITIDIKSIENNNWLLKIIAIGNWKKDDYNFKNPPIIHNWKEDLFEALHNFLGDAITKNT
jgi:hypothetical protein